MSKRRMDFGLAAQRYVDAEMSSADRAAFEARLGADPALRQAVDELLDLRACFAGGSGDAGTRPDRGFASRVLDEIRRRDLPEPQLGDQIRYCELWGRRLVIAAAFLFGLSILVFAGLIREVDSGRLQASQAEMERVMDRLDAAIQKAAVERSGETRKR